MNRDTFWVNNPHLYSFVQGSYPYLKDFEISKQIRDNWHIDIDPEKIRNLRRKEDWKKKECKQPTNNFKKLVFNADEHTPFHDERLFDLFCDQFLSYWKPDIIVKGGDLNDYYDISKFSKNPERKKDIQDEFDIAHNLLKRICKVSPNSKKKFIRGNHENRLTRYLWQHSEIAPLKKKHLNIPKLLELDKLNNISYHEQGFDYHGIYLQHGDNELSKHSGYSAKLSMDKHTCNIIRAHSHRGGTHYKTTWRRNKPHHYVAYEAFCMCQLNPEYVERPNWQQGWICVYIDPNSEYFQIVPVCVVDYKFEFEGRMFVG